MAFALSPVWVEVARHLIDEPWKLPVLAVPWLLWRLVARDGGTGPKGSEAGAGARRTGLIAIGLAVALELLTLGAGLPRWGRPALALAVFGWLRASGLASTPTAALAIFLVPVPSALSRATDPALVDGWRSLAAAILPGVERASFPLDLQHGDAGWAVAWLGAGMGVYAARRLDWRPALLLPALSLGLIGGFVCQGLGVVLAAALSLPLGPELGRAALLGAPLLLLLGLLLVALPRAARTQEARP